MRVSLRRAALLLPLLAAIALAQKDAAPPKLEAGSHYTLLMENEQVRVWRLELPAKAATGLHQHQSDFVSVALTPAELRDQEPRKPYLDGRMQPGDVRVFSSPLAHTITNMGAAALAQIVVELRTGFDKERVFCGKPGQRCPAELGGDIRKGTTWGISTLFETERLKVERIEASPLTEMEWHTHKFPHLAIAVSDLELRNEVQGEGQPQLLQQKSGEVAWIEAGVRHRLANVGRQNAVWVTVEIR